MRHEIGWGTGFNVVKAALVALLLTISVTERATAAGVVGTGTPGSCTEAALDGALAGGGLVTFNCGGLVTISVSSTKVISANTTIDGGGVVTLSGGNARPVIENRAALLTLKNLTIADGYHVLPADISGGPKVDGGGGVRGGWKANLAVENCKFINNTVVSTTPSNDNGGGAIFVHSGTLTITNSEFRDNQSLGSSGGAVHVLLGNADISDSSFEDNSAELYAGAFYNDGTLAPGGGYIRFQRLIFINNTGHGQGGAVFHYLYPEQPGSSVSVDAARFIENSVLPDAGGDAYGGGLRIGNGPLRLTNSTFSGNVARSQGGALWSGEVASVEAQNVTLSNNMAQNEAGSEGLGGGIMIASSGAFNLTNVTMADNHAGYIGGAIFGGGGNVRLRNTIIGLHTAGNPWGIDINCSAVYSNGGNNLQATPNDSSGPQCAAGITIADPLLGPLADNGGLTQTRALLPGSPAIDGGNSSVCSEADQRGQFRFDGDQDGAPTCDIGAYEYAGFDNPSSEAAVVYRNFFTTATPTLTWNAVTWATGYSVQVDNDPTFKTIVYQNDNLSRESLSVTLPPLQTGVYYWRARAKRPDGTWGVWSFWDQIVVNLTAG